MPVPPFVLEARASEPVDGLARIRDELEVPGLHPAPARTIELRVA